MKFGMGTKCVMQMSNKKERIENNAYIINYACLLKTSPLDLKFGMKTKFGMERSNIWEGN